MISVLLFSLAFLCPIVGACIGMALRHQLPEHHLSRESVDVIKLAMGLMATLVALTLGLLIQSASRYRATIETEYRLSLASIVHLDEYLQAYGPGARQLREHLPPRLREIAFEVDVAAQESRAFNPMTETADILFYEPLEDSYRQSRVLDLFKRLPVRMALFRIFAHDETHRHDLIKAANEVLGLAT